ncbi:Endonuclease/exonuclease/phosphatase [Mycena amicta]|nr:Endonuclease/exonuclease/phosphatase [Mycena amicta]
MPPRRASSSKRKADSDDSDNEKVAKKPKTTEASPGQLTNKTLPDNIQFPGVSNTLSDRLPGTLRLATWNVCGLAASQKKGFKRYIEAEDPDILVLTETKVNNEPVDLALKAPGTAILSKHKPLSVSHTLPGHPDPDLVKGRILTLEFENCYVVGTYVVNAGTDLKTLEQKKEWNVHFEAHIRDLDKRKPVIWTGDLNVAPTDLGWRYNSCEDSISQSSLDLSNGKKNWNKTAGYTEAETTAFKNILEPPDENANKFVDVWRQLHPDERQYTYFSYRFNCRLKGIGWRLDMFVLSERIANRVKMCEIRGEIYGASDHCPIVMEYQGTL